MSILDAYEPGGEPIITPDKFYTKNKKITDVAVVCFSLNALQYVLKTYPHEHYATYRATANGEFDLYYLPTFKVLFYMTPVGASVSAGLLQEVAYISGVTKFVYFGSCGVLDPSLRGKYIVPTSCYREEGFSYHYAPPSDYLDIVNHQTVTSFLKEEGLPYAIGKGWTTDAIYNETKAKFEARKKEGVLAVDMEASALQAIANHLKLDYYTFFFAGDILGETWVSGDLGGKNEEARQTSAVDVALRLGRYLSD